MYMDAIINVGVPIGCLEAMQWLKDTIPQYVRKLQNHLIQQAEKIVTYSIGKSIIIGKHQNIFACLCGNIKLDNL